MRLLSFFLIFLLNVFITVEDSFAIKDFILRLDNSSHSITRSISTGSSYPYPLQSQIEENDDYNFFYYTKHFRIIAGNYYKDYPSVQSLMETLGTIAETVWNKEVEELGFKPPKNSDKYYIDIYIANKNAYNPITENYVTISSSYAGYATSYYDGTPYFVINPSLSEDLLKVTIAHEFFHTIQFAYYDFPYMSDEECNENCWWLEATAVWAETVTFPEVLDYINYLNYWIANSYMGLNTYNGDHEYGSSIIPIYLYEENANATVDFIRNSFEEYATHKNFISFLEKNVKKFFKEKTLAEVLMNISTCIANRNCFPHIEYFSNYIFSDLPEYISTSQYGIFPFYIENDAGNNVKYIESLISAIGKINSAEGIFISKKANMLLKSSLIYSNLSLYVPFSSDKWMLLTNPYSKNIEPAKTFGFKDYVLWTYENGTWKCFSDTDSINDLVKQFGFYKENHIIAENQAFWIKTSEAQPNLDNIQNIMPNIDISSNWKLLSLGDILLPIGTLNTIFNSNFVIWTYKNGEWKFYSNQNFLNDIAKSYGIRLIEIIGGIQGYWIKKELR